MDDWYSVIAAESDLPMEGAQQLSDIGFLILQGFASEGDFARMSAAYDRAVLTADSGDVSIRSSTRVNDFVNRGPEFDGIYIYGPLLAACCQVIGRPFKLSTMHARTLEPGAPAQPLHVDVKREADGWPLVGFIVMVDEFTTENGATRFVPGSHLHRNDPDEVLEDATDSNAGLECACGSAGSIIVFNGSV
jgi:Phytanoyl-CoA dioxygenase (PhyH)